MNVKKKMLTATNPWHRQLVIIIISSARVNDQISFQIKIKIIKNLCQGAQCQDFFFFWTHSRGSWNTQLKRFLGSSGVRLSYNIGSPRY